MDSGDENVELLNAAIHRLMEERKKSKEIFGESFAGDGGDDDDQILLSRLLSQLESLKADRALSQPEVSNEENCTAGGKERKTDYQNASGHKGSTDIDKEEIVKELKKVEKQNSVTHWLLSIMIVLTVAWQISEVSIILKLKEGLTEGLHHPFRCVGGMLTGMFRRRSKKSEDEERPVHIEAPPLPPPIKIPEILNVEAPGSNGQQHKH